MSHHRLILPKPIRGYFKESFSLSFATLINVRYVLIKYKDGYSKILFKNNKCKISNWVTLVSYATFAGWKCYLCFSHKLG